MFSCCALFSTDDVEADTEHLNKALDDVERAKEGEEMSISIDEDGTTGSLGRSFEQTPLATSPRMAAAQHRALEALAAAELAESASLQASISNSKSNEEDRAAAEAETMAHEASIAAEARVAAQEEARAAAQAEADTASAERADQTLQALKEAEDLVHAAAAEAEKRRFEEEASAEAARQAGSNAKKALRRAEEATRVKEATSMKAKEEKEAAQLIYEEEAELARREQAAARVSKALDQLKVRLSSRGGLRLQKHGRNGKSTFRTLKCPDEEFLTLTWGKTVYDLRAMQEVRKGTDPDPSHSGLTGTLELRRSKLGFGARDRSFSLLFPSRSLDFTAGTKEESEQLVLGFQALASSKRA